MTVKVSVFRCNIKEAKMEAYEVVDENNNVAYLHVEETVADTTEEETVEETAAETE